MGIKNSSPITDDDLQLIIEGKYAKEVPILPLMAELLRARQLLAEAEDLIGLYRVAVNGPQVRDL